MRSLDGGEGQVGSLEAAGQRRGIVGLRIGDVLGGDLVFPEVSGDKGLIDTGGS